MTTPKGPVLIEIGAPDADASRRAEPGARATLHDRAGAAPNPADAPPVPDIGAPPPSGRAMQTLATLGARRPSRLMRWFWSLAVALMGALVSLAAWDYVTGLIARTPLLGYAIGGLIGAFVLVCLALAVRELAAFGRLARVDAMHRAAETALSAGDLEGARAVVRGLTRFYAGRADTDWGRKRLAERESDLLDAPALLALAEAELMAPLDRMAEREVEAAARQVATVTALVPLALADVAAALTANLRMIRRVATIYGGRAGGLSSWRLARSVMTHLVATGAVAVGDDMLEPVIGGGLLGKLSRRFGEGLVNGALTARVGVAAM